MKKQGKIILIFIISFIILYGVMFFVDMNRVKQLKKPIFCIENGYMGSMTRFDGLGYKIGLDINATTGKVTYGQMTMLGQYIVKLYSKDENITLEDINDKISNYFINEDNDIENLSHFYIDEKKKKVVVGLAGNTKEEQEKFINNVFSECCGSEYIKYIKDNSILEFEETKYTFDAEIIEIKDNEIIVKVLKTTKQLKKDDKVRMKMIRSTDETKGFYVVGNNVKITAKGIILTSNPAIIDVINVELIN